MIYFIADTHFSEETIRLYENRPFADIAEMDRQLILRWNHCVNQEDKVYVLGDFGADGQEALILSQLIGHVHNSPIFHTYSSHHYCVSAERIHYTPLSFDEIIRAIQSSKNKD